MNALVFHGHLWYPGYRQEIAERDATIGEKEKRIFELKKRNQELEKWKFVLDYRIKDLKRQIEPRENDITRMRGEIKQKDLVRRSYVKMFLIVA